jgi:hypothetical protein
MKSYEFWMKDRMLSHELHCRSRVRPGSWRDGKQIRIEVDWEETSAFRGAA